ncbi:hypothetical protein [Leptospira licerasiae]|uniref:hypothetical protein n=1 Tax=Leptospira licerasiae TaxID=447106 RepID=UPI0010824432|nr:hypothetical protein [Leptospira licerasiae]TGM87891.1 hypothetical protein EHR05_14640 [Leptospira licerasiae]
MRSSTREKEEPKEFVPNWKIPWQDFSAFSIPRKGRPLIFIETSGSFFIGRIDREGLIQVSDSGYIYSKSEGRISRFAYIENINDGLVLFPNRPEMDRLLIIKDNQGEYFLGKLNKDGLIERLGTGYRYSIRDGFLLSWIYANCPSNLQVSIGRTNSVA